MHNWKEYLIALIANFTVGFLLSMNCKGEGCMIIILAIVYGIIAAIAYLPYLFYKRFKDITHEKFLAYFAPSLLMFTFNFLYLKLGSNMPANSHNLFFICLTILPNTALQFVFWMANRKNSPHKNAP